MRRRNSKGGTLVVAFGAGMLLACFCPPSVLVAILAIAVLVLGVIYLKF